MRGCQEHRDLCWGDVKLCKDAQGNDYLVYNERQTKTRSGVDASNVRKVSPKMFSTGDERDPVVAYKIYREKRPENMMADDSLILLGNKPHENRRLQKTLVQVGTYGCK